MYVILNAGRYVAKSGRSSSYCKRIEYAQVYKTREEAEKNKCGNESIQDLNQVISNLVYEACR